MVDAITTLWDVETNALDARMMLLWKTKWVEAHLDNNIFIPAVSPSTDNILPLETDMMKADSGASGTYLMKQHATTTGPAVGTPTCIRIELDEN